MDKNRVEGSGDQLKGNLKEGVGHLTVQPATGRDQRHAQHQAGNKNPEVTATGAQVAPSQTKQEAHGWRPEW